MPNDCAFRQDQRGVLHLDPLRNSYRLAVTVKSQPMTLTKDRIQTRSLESPQAASDPQGCALKHLRRTAMRAMAASPVKDDAQFALEPMHAS
jgi:hypothetical protein